MYFILPAGVALLAAAPIGPISILTIHRAVSLGFSRAFWPTLGAVAADGIFGAAAALGAGYFTTAIMGGKFWLRIIGSLILLGMGWRLFTRHRADRTGREDSFGNMRLAILNFTLVLSNPLTLAFYMTAFALLGLESTHVLDRHTSLMTAGIISGASSWFFLLCVLSGLLRHRVDSKFLLRVRRGIGVLFMFLAVLSAAAVLLA